MADRLHRLARHGRRLRGRRPSRPSDAALLTEVRGGDFSAYSDADLKSALVSAANGGDALPAVYAVVAETIHRRMGLWRAFGDGAAPAAIRECRDVAAEVLDAAPYRARVEYYADEDFVDGPLFAASLEAALDRLRLSPERRAVVSGAVYVAEKSRTTPLSQIMLPAEFYGAVQFLDADGELAFRVTDEQLTAGIMLYRGAVVEMSAGEGKTVAAAFPAILHALTDRRVHVVTANDYLAARDAEWLADVYEALGVSVSAVLGHMGDADRRAAYRSRIVYGTVRELGFDFLRDNMKLSADETVQRERDVAIVDEADQTLIDEAGTPLIISGGPPANTRGLRRADQAVRQLIGRQAAVAAGIAAELRRPDLTAGRRRSLLARLSLADHENECVTRELSADRRLLRQVRTEVAAREPDSELERGLYYVVDARSRTVTLTDAGNELVEDSLGPLFDLSELDARLRRTESGHDGAPLERRRSDAEALRRQMSRRCNIASQVHQLLHAHLLLRHGVDYIVVDGEVVLVDPVTGRRRPDSRYRNGLHAAIEAKEHLPPRPEPEVQAQISVQGYVSRYRRVCGMTGTAVAAADEFRRFYGLEVEVVPPANRSVRTDLPTRIFDARGDKQKALVHEVRHWRRMGRPVLVGTAAVRESEEISELLRRHDVPHTLLNAVTSASEAAVVAAAGRLGAVTVATNMAGRGTDILLEPGLDRRVADGCARMAAEALADGAPAVTMRCSTAEEAAAAETALREAGVAAERGDRPHDVVARPDDAEARSGAPITMEFGLGLHVIGTDLNDSRRIDDQLRGRVGRQGAFGSTRFLLSAEDDSLLDKPNGGPSYRSERRDGVDGIVHQEGLRTQRSVDRLQRLDEREEELGRMAAWEIDRVVERQTLAYYGLRSRVLDDGFSDETLADFAAAAGRRLVDRHLPESDAADYAARFARLAEEATLDYGVDLSASFGLGIPSLRTATGQLVARRVRQAQFECSRVDFDTLARLLMVQAADELWPVHLSRLQDMALGAHLSGQTLGRTVADYAFAVTEEYNRFLTTAQDAFLVELIAYREADVEPEPSLPREVQEVLV